MYGTDPPWFLYICIWCFLKFENCFEKDCNFLQLKSFSGLRNPESACSLSGFLISVKLWTNLPNVYLSPFVTQRLNTFRVAKSGKCSLSGFWNLLSEHIFATQKKIVAKFEKKFGEVNQGPIGANDLWNKSEFWL